MVVYSMVNRWLAMILPVSMSLFTNPGLMHAAEPVRLIFDTDIGNDVDDVLALGMIHSLQDRGACRLLAVTITKDSELAGPFVDLLNTFYHRGSTPIGMVRPGKTPEPGKFLPMAAEKTNGTFRYPHKLIRSDDAPEAVGLLRKLLAAEPDGSVSIAQVGFSTNLALWPERTMFVRPPERPRVSLRFGSSGQGPMFYLPMTKIQLACDAECAI